MTDCDCPPDACLCDLAASFNATQERLRAERDRYREALEAIGTDCENYTGAATCVSAGRARGARYTADAWCKQCIARMALRGTDR